MKKEKVIGKYKDWKIKKSLAGNTKGLVYAERKYKLQSGKMDTEGFGLLGGENTVQELKENLKERNKLFQKETKEWN